MISEAKILPLIPIMRKALGIYDNLDRGIPNVEDELIISTRNESKLKEIDSYIEALRILLKDY